MMKTRTTALTGVLVLALSTGATTAATAAPLAGVPSSDPSPSATPGAPAQSEEDQKLAAVPNELQTDLTQMREAQDRAQAQYDEAQSKAEKLRKLVEANQAAADQARLVVGQYARTIYMSGPTDLSVLASMIDTSSPDDLMRRADEALRVGDHKDFEYDKAVALLKRNQEMKTAADTAETAAEASLSSIQNQVTGLRQQLADGVGKWAEHLAGQTTMFDADQAKRNGEAASAWAAYLSRLADWRVPSITSQDLLKRRLPRKLQQFRRDPGVAYWQSGDRETVVLPERTVAAVTYAVSKLGTSYRWRANTESQLDCSSLIDRAWNIPSIPKAKRGDERDLVEDGASGVAARTRLIPSEKLNIGDVVFVADRGRGVNHTGIVLDSHTMIAADSSTGAVNALDIPADRVWQVGRLTLAPPKKDNAVPEVTRKPFQCGADPASFILIPDSATTALAGQVIANPAMCPPSSVFAEGHMQEASIRGGRCTAAIWPQIQIIGGWRPSDPYPDHPSGRAIDIMMPAGCSTDASNVGLGNAIAEFFMHNAGRFQVQYIIWQQRIWTSDSEPTPPPTWRGMSNRGGCTSNHMDHVHVSFTGPNVTPGVSAEPPSDDEPDPKKD